MKNRHSHPNPAVFFAIALILVTPVFAAGDEGSEKLAPESLVVTDATIWTQGPDGRLESADLLVVDGRIVAIGQESRNSSGRPYH